MTGQGELLCIQGDEGRKAFFTIDGREVFVVASFYQLPMLPVAVKKGG